MAQKDMTTKTLEWYNDVFADTLNVFLFNGRAVVKENVLIPADKDSQYKADNKIRE